MVDLTAAEVYRDFVSDGIPSSGEHDPKKPDIRRLLGQYEQIISAFTSNGGLIYSSLASLNADLSKPANSMAWVMGDPIAANNGVYGKVGAPGAGSWTRRADLPFPVIVAEDGGEGTPNAIQATSALPVSGSSLVTLSIYENNTASPVTVSFNGGASLTMKTNSGNDIPPGGLPSIVLGRVSGAIFRLVSDVISSAIIAAAEGFAEEAQEARDEAVAAAAGVDLPPVAPNSMLVDNAAGTARESKTFDQVKALWDPSNQLLLGEGLRLTYHKARGSRHVKAFQTGATLVGTGNTTADTAALTAAMASQEMIDIDGAVLQIDTPIVIDYPGANISARKSGRVGDVASSKIKLMNDAMPCLFDCRSTNWEISGFAINGNTTNTTTTAVLAKRPDGSARDIDGVIKDVVFERMSKAFHIYGRGLELGDCTIAEMKTCAGDVDWPSVSTPNGNDNDTDETGMRAYHFYNTRLHGNNAGFRNIGANAKNMRGLIIDGALADIGIGGTGGGGIFIGVLGEGSVLSNLVANIGASIAGALVNLKPGSRSAVINGFSCKGIKSGVTRKIRSPITIETTVADPVFDIMISNGTLGVCDRYGVLISGAGTAYVTLSGVAFDRTGMENAGYAPIHVLESGGTLTDVWVKLSACGFRFGGETAPNSIIGGLNTAAVHLRRDYTTTKPAAIAWAGNLVDNMGPS